MFICFLTIYELSNTFIDETKSSVNLTLKPGSSASVSVGIRIDKSFGVLPRRLPLHTPGTVATPSTVKLAPFESIAFTLLKRGSVH